MEQYVYTVIPEKKRLRNAVVMAVIVVVTACAFTYGAYQAGAANYGYCLITAYVLLGGTAAYRIWTTKEAKELSESAKAKLEIQRAEQQKKDDELMRKWYFRYPMAILLVSLAIGTGIYYGHWWFSLCIAMFGLLFVPEVLFIAIGLIVTAISIYLIFNAISMSAKLPAGAAIIIGALIIAAAIRSKK